jgi:hypothetical protein
MSELLYLLKHQYPSAIKIVRTETIVDNYETGERTHTRRTYEIDKAIEASNTWLARVFNKTIVDQNSKAWVIDDHDLDDFVPQLDDLVQDSSNNVFTIAKMENVPGGVLIVCKRTEGVRRNAILNPSIEEGMEWNDGPGGTI